VVNDFGRRGGAYCETDVEAADLETVIQDLLDGQYWHPVRVVSFNTAEGWSQDISANVAEELRRRCDLQMREIPSNILDFMERYETASPLQLTLRAVIATQWGSERLLASGARLIVSVFALAPL
jgi:hypothetical protein